jgi:hypothetical protein
MQNEFTNILWMPIDIPKCPIQPTVITGNFWAWWEFNKLTQQRTNPYDESEWADETKDKYPEFVEWFKHFPYKNLRNVKVNRQVKAVEPHIDFHRPDLHPILHHNNNKNEPCGYRILINGNRNKGLYVMRGEEKIYCDIPDDTDTYVLGHTSTMHGVDDDDNRITIFTHFEIDAEKNKTLLQKSFEKYGSYAILSK